MRSGRDARHPCICRVLRRPGVHDTRSTRSDDPRGAASGLAIGGGVRYVGSTYGTDTNVWDNIAGFATSPSKVPGYTLFDAMVSYDFGVRTAALKGWSAMINARNLFDKTYVSYCQSAVACQYGLGRTVIATLTYRW